MKTLYDYQERAIAELRQALTEILGKDPETDKPKRVRRVVLEAPTGAGKTVIASEIIRLFRTKQPSNRVIFTVPLISLIDQTVERFQQHGLRDIGVIQAKHAMTDETAMIQVCSVQTLNRRDLPKDVSLVLVDECHLHSEAVPRMMAEYPDAVFVGFSATPWAKGMGLLWQRKVQVTTIAELIERGKLSRFTVFAPDVPDLSGVKTKAGDYDESGSAEIMSGTALMGSIVQTWLEKGDNRPTLLFGVNRVHAKELQEAFLRAGVSAGYCDAWTDSVERRRLAEQFASGEIKIACSVRTLTTGVDWAVSCIIDAAPTKSEMLHVQKIGRGLRVNPGTEDCIAADTLILTDKGLCKIQDVTLDHMVWDGVNFVSHSGAVCRGVRSVIQYDGLTATPDHKVMTNEGWMQFAEAARRKLRIARTGIGRVPVRFHDNCVAQGYRQGASPFGGGRVCGLRGSDDDAVSQHEKASRSRWVRNVQAKIAGKGSALAVSALSSAARSVLQSSFDFFCSLRRAWHQIFICQSECCCALGCGKFGSGGTGNGVGPNKQRWSLRTWEFAVGASCAEYSQQPEVEGLSRSVHNIQEGKSRRKIFRSLATAHDKSGENRCADYSKMDGFSGQQSSEEVWDILNAGPLQRFTANGRLVHNCLILDHAGNSLRLGLVTDIAYGALSTNERKVAERKEVSKEKLPKPCPKCSALFVGRTCPACGHDRKPFSGIEYVEGQLVELTPKAKAPTMEEKQVFFSGLLWIARDRGYKSGWAANQYREKFKVWPRGLSDIPLPPTQSVQNYVKSRAIAWAKRRKEA